MVRNPRNVGALVGTASVAVVVIAFVAWQARRQVLVCGTRELSARKASVELSRNLLSPREGERLAAMQDMVAHGVPTSAILEQVVLHLKTDPSEGVRQLALILLWHEASASNPDAVRRRLASAALLHSLAHDPRPEIRWRALNALSESSETFIIPRLVAVISSEPDHAMRAAVLRFLLAAFPTMEGLSLGSFNDWWKEHGSMVRARDGWPRFVLNEAASTGRASSQSVED